MIELSRFRVASLGAFALALVACATPEPVAPAAPPVVPLTNATPEQMVASIRKTADDGARELAVQPLRDPAVEDLRAAAKRDETARKYVEAANAYDDALAIVPDDPALLQDRAEISLLLKDFKGAESRAKRAFEIGSQVGPLCRRHWATVEQARLVAGDAEGAAMARREIEGCKVAGVNRY